MSTFVKGQFERCPSLAFRDDQSSGTPQIGIYSALVPNTGTNAEPERPVGREEIRKAIIDAATDHFARRGRAASLRDIAASAEVNLGLIHRHVGNKDDLIRAVLAEQAVGGQRIVEEAPDLAQAAARIFEQVSSGAPYVDIVARLLMDGTTLDQFQTSYPTIDALRDKAANPAQQRRLLLAFAAMYGWAVFGDDLMDAFGHTVGERDEIKADLRDLIAQLVSENPTS